MKFIIVLLILIVIFNIHYQKEMGNRDFGLEIYGSRICYNGENPHHCFERTIENKDFQACLENLIVIPTKLGGIDNFGRLVDYRTNKTYDTVKQTENYYIGVKDFNGEICYSIIEGIE